MALLHTGPGGDIRPTGDEFPLPVTLEGEGSAVDQGAPGDTPWKVDDDATQTAITALAADGGQATLGAKADAAWAGSGSGSVVAILKAIYAKVAATLGFATNAGVTNATTLRVITASDGPLNTNLGTTTDAAVVSDADGSVSSKLRGLVKLLASVISSNRLLTTSRTEQFTAPATGELAGNTNATQMPNVACNLVMFKAEYNNVGRVYIGVSGVTKQDGSTDTTTGYELSAGESTPWIPVDNLNRFFRICDNAGDDLTYLALA